MAAIRAEIVFLDRDGTINFDPGYFADPGKVEILPGVAQGLALLRAAGMSLVVVSNQSAIGRGLVTREAVEATNGAVLARLAELDRGAKIDLVVYCPHAPEENCLCRKPKSGLLHPVAERFEFDPRRCWMIGDKRSDLLFAAAAGIPAEQSLLVLTGHGKEELAKIQNAEAPQKMVCAFETFFPAAEHIIEQRRAEKRFN